MQQLMLADWPYLLFALALASTCALLRYDDGHNSPNHPVSPLSDVRQVRVAGAHVEELSLHGLAPGLVSRCGRHIMRNPTSSSSSSGSSDAVGAYGRCSAARIRHSSSPDRSCSVSVFRRSTAAVVSTLGRPSEA